MNADTKTLPTPYQDINLFLQIFLDKARVALGEQFNGMYLYGSLAIGDFDPIRSDIDFLVVTSAALPDRLVSDLNSMHTSLYESGLEWGTKLNGAYIPLGAVRRYSPTDPAYPLVNKKDFLVAPPESDWIINRHILYTSGVVIAGPPLQTILDPIQPEQLRESVLALLRDTWTPWIHNGDLFASIECAQSFVVLTMCRALYTLKHGAVASKRRSAEWIIDNSDGKWTSLVMQAMAWQNGDPPGNIGETQEFMQYVFGCAGL